MLVGCPSILLNFRGTVRLYSAKTGVFIALGEGVLKNNDSLPSDFIPALELEKVSSLAIVAQPGKVIKSIELETEHGLTIYSVNFTDGTRIYIDATTGLVVPKNVVELEDENDESSSSSGSNFGTDGVRDEDNDRRTTTPTSPTSTSTSGSGVSGSGSSTGTSSGSTSGSGSNDDSGSSRSGSGSGKGSDDGKSGRD
jgi:Peptidase propeptide and YPEB domain